MTSEFRNHGIVPDFIQNFEPVHNLQVRYPSGMSAQLGNVLTPTQVKDIPYLSWDADPNALHTIILLDPDAPSRSNPQNAPWLHWLVVNVQGERIENGDILAYYIGSGPPPDTGLHRYILLVFRQNAVLPKTMQTYGAASRSNFDYKNFFITHELGNPIAGNFYLAEYDDYVPILYKNLEGK